MGEVCWNLPLLFSPLAWLERRLADGTPEGTLCSLPPIPTPTLALLTPALLTPFQSDHIPGKLGRNHCTSLLEPCSPSPSPKGGRKPELKPRLRRAAREPCLCLRTRLPPSSLRGAPQRTSNFLPLQSVCLHPPLALEQ